MYFCPFVILSDTGESISVAIDLASKADLAATHEPSEWQTDWTSEYLSAPSVVKSKIVCKMHRVNIGNFIEVRLIDTRNDQGRGIVASGTFLEGTASQSPSLARKRGQTIRRVCWISAISDNLLGTSDIRKA